MLGLQRGRDGQGKTEIADRQWIGDAGVRQYPPEAGGYTPGDTWDLFLGPDGRTKQFTYHRGGPKKPNLLSTTWAGYKKAGPLLVSTDHRGTAEGAAAHIFFSNVAVKQAGSDTWMDAK